MNTKQTISKNYGKNTRGKTYPVASARQALRGARRAQQGPGITTGENPVRNAYAWERSPGVPILDFVHA